jgi:hypothetical protein
MDCAKAIRYLPDSIFYPLVAERLNEPLKPSEMIVYNLRDKDFEYWTIEYLVGELFKQLASSKAIIEYNNRTVTINKYFTEARRIWKWIPIARPPPVFVIKMSDLSARVFLELNSLNKSDYNYVIRRAVCQIFEYIDPDEYRPSIAKNLVVRLDK